MNQLKVNTRSLKVLAEKIMKKYGKLIFFITGALSVLWIFWRLVTKPSRASYPCVQAAYPVAASFILYLTSLTASIFSYKYAAVYARKSKYFISFLLLIFTFISGFFAFQADQPTVLANVSNSYTSNQPMGTPKGVIPGRVIWAHNPNATDENWSTKSPGNYITNNYTNIDTVERMVNESILKLTETSSIKEAWDSMFVYFNKQHGKGAISYTEGEHIFIKCNFVTAFTQTKSGPTWTSPQILRAIFRHLVNNMSIPQENIAFGDPMCCVTDAYWDILHTEFPNVKYIDHQGGNGRTFAEKGIQSDIFYSDRGEILRDSYNRWDSLANSGDPVYSDTLYKIIEDADYMINIAPLKGHSRSGVTLCAKNHFGSHVRTTAAHLHMGLTRPDGKDEYNTRFGYGKYRVLVDLMGHRKLGGNTLLSVVDGLWGGPGAGSKPSKYSMAPFNNDYPSSLFMSQDQVALESVGLDFLQGMYPTGKPQLDGVDDYLQQAADPTKWPENFVYDPENDGTPLTSLGVHEHWNNPIDKQYSIELGGSNGIDLIKLNGDNTTSVDGQKDKTILREFTLSQNYPNPFNPTTVIKYNLPQSEYVVLRIYNSVGEEIETIVDGFQTTGEHKVTWQPNGLTSGVYFYRLQAGDRFETKKLILQK